MSAQQCIIQELEDAVSHGSSERRAETLRRVTDLFVSGAVQYDDEQIALFDEVIGHLVAEIETAARAELAARLAPVPNAPPTVVRNLACDEEIAVAGPVLAQSSRLDDATLVAISKAAGQPHLLAISQRKVLNEEVTDVLLERGDRGTVLSVAKNAGARISQPGYVSLVRRSENDDEIATHVGARADLPRYVFLQLLAKASETVRKKLEQINSQRAGDVQQIVASVATRIGARAAAMSRDYRSAEVQVRSLHSSGGLSETHLDGFAKAGKFEEVTVALALLCGVPIEIVERAMMHERPETLLILAKAAGLAWPVVKSLLLLRSQGRGMSVHDADQCLTNYQRLKQSTAQQVMRLPRFSGQQNG